MIDLERYPRVKEAGERRRKDQQRYDRHIQWAETVGAQNNERLAQHRQAVRAAEIAGALPPEQPRLLDITPPPFDLQERREQWRDERERAILAHADEIVEDAASELRRLDDLARPLREKLDAIEREISDVKQVAHTVRMNIQRASRAPGHVSADARQVEHEQLAGVLQNSRVTTGGD
jgi:hypothetical protein